MTVPFASNDSFTKVVESLKPWTTSLKLPKGTRVAFGKLWERGETKTLPFLRTYVLKGDVILTAADVKSTQLAISDTSPFFEITLKPAAQQRLKAVKKESTQRLALVVDGEVLRPAETKYLGDSLTIAPGSGNFDADKKEAQRLADALAP